MKLKTKLLMPLLAIVPTIATIAPIAASCGNTEKEEKKYEIKTNLITDVSGGKINASKTSITEEEMKKGFSITFEVKWSGEFVDEPVFVLDNVVMGSKELNISKYTVKYSEAYGIYGREITVEFGANIVNDKLSFNFHFDASLYDVPVEVVEYSDKGDEFVADPALIEWDTWDGLLAAKNDSVDYYAEVLYLNIYYSDSQITDPAEAELIEMMPGIEYTRPSTISKKGYASATVSYVGWAHLATLCLTYNYAVVELNWQAIYNK